MTITLYNVTDAPNVLNKSLGTGTAITTAQPVQPCDFLAPAFILDKSSGVLSANYLVTDSTLENRCYFITDKQLISGGRVLVSCAVDVLSTYATDIIASTGVVMRAENPQSIMLHDSKFPITNYRDTYSYLFNATPFSAANGWNYLLTVVGL